MLEISDADDDDDDGYESIGHGEKRNACQAGMGQLYSTTEGMLAQALRQREEWQDVGGNYAL